METIASFDIGARNLACCILEKKTGEFPKIKFWKLINILDEPEEIKCQVLIKSGKKKDQICSRIAHYKNNKEENVCKMHDSLKRKKPNIKKVKSYTTQDINLLILKKMNEINLTFSFCNNVDKVLFELQPSFNPKMKQLSHTLYAWFLMEQINNKNCKLKKLEFVAAKNKLKKIADIYHGPDIICNLKGKYPRTKYYSKMYTEWLINKEDLEYKTLLDKSSKKDDLCDSYLQGLWYFLFKKTIKTR